jgi:hypothetical protein
MRSNAAAMPRHCCGRNLQAGLARHPAEHILLHAMRCALTLHVVEYDPSH